jgi:ADP-ribose pyrophosphatase YjhB (NUDIX family)
LKLLQSKIDVDMVRSWFDEIDAANGIGEDLYLAISQLTPSINVDLIIKSDDGLKTLLTWRDDRYYGPGWHVPGGVIRFKEKMLTRVHKVAEKELQRHLSSVNGPIGFHEMFNQTRDIRGHFISFVYEVTLAEPPAADQGPSKVPKNGQWQWFETCPENLISNQSDLRGYI